VGLPFHDSSHAFAVNRGLFSPFSSANLRFPFRETPFCRTLTCLFPLKTRSLPFFCKTVFRPRRYLFVFSKQAVGMVASFFHVLILLSYYSLRGVFMRPFFCRKHDSFPVFTPDRVNPAVPGPQSTLSSQCRIFLTPRRAKDYPFDLSPRV